MVDTVYWLPIMWACSSSWLAWSKDHLAPLLYSSRELSELSQWLCSYDDSTINIIVVIIIIAFQLRFTKTF